MFLKIHRNTYMLSEVPQRKRIEARWWHFRLLCVCYLPFISSTVLRNMTMNNFLTNEYDISVTDHMNDISEMIYLYFSVILAKVLTKDTPSLAH